MGEGLVDRLGPLGGDPLLDKPILDRFGGAPANVACALARLGTDVAFLGRLGDDLPGNQFRDLMKSRGLNLIGLQSDSERPTRVVLVRRDLKGERFFEGFVGDLGHGFADQALDLNQLKNVCPNLFSDASWLVIGTIPLASNLSRDSLIWVVDYALNKGIKIAIDVNWRPTFWDVNLSPDSAPSQLALDLIFHVLNKSSLVKLAKEEADWFFDNDDPKYISNALSSMPDVVITDGSKPINWFINGEQGCIEAVIPDAVIDTTGAGDAFTAGLIHKRVSAELFDGSKNIKDMIIYAAASGAYVCGGSGAIEPQPTTLQLNRFLALKGGCVS